MRTVVVLEGDQTGQELLEEARRAMHPDVTGVALAFERFGLSLEERRRTSNGVVSDAAKAMRDDGLGLKAATITPEVHGGTDSLNAIVRELIDGSVMLLVGSCRPGVRTVGGAYASAPNVLTATEDAYNASECCGCEAGSSNEMADREDRVMRANCWAVSG